MDSSQSSGSLDSTSTVKLKSSTDIDRVEDDANGESHTRDSVTLNNSRSTSRSGSVTRTDKSSQRKSRGQQANHNKPSTSLDGGEGIHASQNADDLKATEDVIQMLENVDLTEEETEELLKDAYALNKRLRKQLDKQSIPAPLHRSQTLGGSRQKGAGVKGEPLPPISSGSRKRHEVASPSATIDIYSAKINRRSVPHAIPERHHRNSSATATGNTGMRLVREIQSPSMGKLQRGRPEWDERFPYS